MKPGEVHVWRIPTAGKPAAYAALRGILARFTDPVAEFARTSSGKPYLPGAQIKFNLAHSRGMAMVAIALDVEVGVDVERVRPLPDHQAIAERYFPAGEVAHYTSVPDVEREREFFRCWTRIEAVLKARGVGLYGAGEEPTGDWTIQEIDIGTEFFAAVAVPRAGVQVVLHDYVAGQADA